MVAALICGSRVSSTPISRPAAYLSEQPAKAGESPRE
jgi:hypothetical protein